MAGRAITKNLMGFAKFGLVQGLLLGLLSVLLFTFANLFLTYLFSTNTINAAFFGGALLGFFVLVISSVVIWVVNGLIFNGVFTGRIKALNLSCTSPLVSASILGVIGSALAASWLGFVFIVILNLFTLEILKLLKWKQPFSGG